jgi:type I restriction enzyme M protein
LDTFDADIAGYSASVKKQIDQAIPEAADNAALHAAASRLAPLADTSRDLIKTVDHLHKLAGHVLDASLAAGLTEQNDWPGREFQRARKDADEVRKQVVDALKPVRYFHRQAHWLQERFPDAQLCDVPGLVKLVNRDELATNDWTLTPGRYVGVAPEEVDEDFDFEAAIKDIHIELQGLNSEAGELAAKIARNFEELGA